jgi:deoxyribodipyrimidine photo-lyase
MPTTHDIALCWFREDLRITDNPALSYALQNHAQVVCVYLQTSKISIDPPASVWWQQHAILDLAKQLQGRLIYRIGDVQTQLQAIITEYKICALYWNRVYDPIGIARDTALKRWLKSLGIQVQSFPGNILFEPWQIVKHDQTPYRVFTPFYKACLAQGIPINPLPLIDQAHLARLVPVTFDEKSVRDKIPTAHWANNFSTYWQPTRTAGLAQLNTFIEHAMPIYDKGRDIPAAAQVSHLAPYLQAGQLSAREIIAATQPYNTATAFVRQIIWREFAHYVLYHWPHTCDQPMDTRYIHFPWQTNPTALHAWQRGQTGIPFVDAGMRQLWQTGYMHNRLRMVAASFLCKHLMIDWRVGADWFMYTLLDANLANNSLGWQWVAGSGVDAAPYFRIFNPVTQGQRFDPNGETIRQWIPALKALPNQWIHQPWAAPTKLLHTQGIQLGRDYPYPIVDLATGRKAALTAWETIKHH